MPLRNWIDSTNNAIEGILVAAKNEKHLRYHLYAAAIVLIFCYFAGVAKTDFLIISLIVLFVIITELINSTIEAMVDLLSPEKREKARIAKDIAAGAVLTTAVVSVIIGYTVLFPYFKTFFDKGIYIVKHSSDEIALLSLIIVIIMVIITKAITGKGHPLRGGLPSGHAAVSFSCWVSITIITENFPVSLLSLLMAIVIAQSRIAIKAHNRWEAFLGALMGSVVTFFLFIIFT